MNTDYSMSNSCDLIIKSPFNPCSKEQIEFIEIKSKDPSLEIVVQKFNPSTSPPINSFMERLSARSLIYSGK